MKTAILLQVKLSTSSIEYVFSACVCACVCVCMATLVAAVVLQISKICFLNSADGDSKTDGLHIYRRYINVTIAQ